ncbi:hypothetical protein AQUCO_00100325v1 [Aquilegia coerulea]|uniref:Uncharacterized protein n=1 Tax=Aquilegia coerulea TaxID=218851 RepID=A0A2G5F9U7_AQUCA|nr:hypothetical protein AQUCO_00100325v1 [Aquilegia coerulea]
MAGSLFNTLLRRTSAHRCIPHKNTHKHHKSKEAGHRTGNHSYNSVYYLYHTLSNEAGPTGLQKHCQRPQQNINKCCRDNRRFEAP